MSPALLSLQDVVCGYGGQTVVTGLNLDLASGEIGCLLGPSGCGKTTTLRAIAGFEAVSRGSIRLAGAEISRPGHTLAIEQRKVGMVFQEYALFPHLSVAQNVAFGIRQHPQQARVVAQMLELVGLRGLADRHPQQLSGGQQQRVALARALAPGPKLLLLDEPFSNLDVTLRRRLSLEVREILKQRGISALLVTHDQEEAFAVGDQIGVFHHGRLEQWATPAQLYHQPVSAYVAGFVGQGFFVSGRVVGHGRVLTELGTLSAHAAPADTIAVDVLLRPEDIGHAPDSPVKAQVLGQTFMGATRLYRLQLPSGTPVQAMFPAHIDCAAGEETGIQVCAAPRWLYPASTDQGRPMSANWA